MLADEDRVSYEAAGAKSAGVFDLWHPKVVAKGALTGVREKTSRPARSATPTSSVARW